MGLVNTFYLLKEDNKPESSQKGWVLGKGGGWAKEITVSQENQELQNFLSQADLGYLYRHTFCNYLGESAAS